MNITVAFTPDPGLTYAQLTDGDFFTFGVRANGEVCQKLSPTHYVSLTAHRLCSASVSNPNGPVVKMRQTAAAHFAPA